MKNKQKIFQYILLEIVVPTITSNRKNIYIFHRDWDWFCIHVVIGERDHIKLIWKLRMVMDIDFLEFEFAIFMFRSKSSVLNVLVLLLTFMRSCVSLLNEISCMHLRRTKFISNANLFLIGTGNDNPSIKKWYGGNKFHCYSSDYLATVPVSHISVTCMQ